MTYLLGNKGAHIYNGNMDYNCSNCKRTFRSPKTLSNHKCSHCVHCKRTYSSYQNFISHECSQQSVVTSLLCSAEPEKLCRMINSDLLIPDEVICYILNMLRTAYPETMVGVLLPAEVNVIRSYQVKPEPKVPVNKHSVNIHYINGHWLTSWQDPCQMTVHLFDSLYSENRAEQMHTDLELFYDFSKFRLLNEKCTSQQSLPNCGVFAAAFAYYCCQHINPKQFAFKELSMRENLITSILTNQMQPFPRNEKEQNRIRMQQKRDQTIYRKKEETHRQSLQYKQKQKMYKQKLRLSDVYKEIEVAQKNKRRQFQEYKIMEKVHKQTKRQSEAYKEKGKLHMQTKRQSEAYKEKEKLHKQSKRQSEAYKEKEKVHKQTKRQSEAYKEKEKVHKQSKRQSEAYKEKEKVHKQSKRQSEAYKEKGKVYMQTKRQSEAYKEKEKLHKQSKRQSEAYKEKEKVQMQSKRLSNLFRVKEKIYTQCKRKSAEYIQREMARRQQKRKNIDVLESERISKKHKRLNIDYRRHERIQKETNAQINIIRNFHNFVKKGPIYICTCCDQLWYKTGVTKASGIKTDQNLKDKCITGRKSYDGLEYICFTCKNYLLKNKVPPLSKANGITFPQKPVELDLTNMEERLVAARIPFMLIRELPRGGQASITGNMVNVPTNVNRTVTSLPRLESENECIAVKLKRKLCYKSHYCYEYIRPNKVKEAVHWLIQNSTLYQREGIVMNEAWGMHNEHVSQEQIEDLEEHSCVDTDLQDQPDDAQHIIVDTDLAENTESFLPASSSNKNLEEQFERDTHELDNLGPRDTKLIPFDLMEDSRNIFPLAPGEGSSSLSIFLDRNAESLAFPSLFCGEERKEPHEYVVKVHISDLYKSELRRADRRVAGHIGNIFYKLKHLQMKPILDKASVCVRKTCLGQELNAGFLKCSKNLSQLIHTDKGFRIFKDLRGSPPYWEKVKKDLFALIRSLGIPSWFASFSSADTSWIHLLQILGQTVDNKSYSEEEVKQFPWQKSNSL